MSEKATETEIEIYSRITNFKGLMQADKKETHIQANFRFSETASLRVRKTINGNETIYEETIKIDKPIANTASSKEETTILISQLFFDEFLQGTEHYMHKDRYIFISKDQALTLELNEKTITIVVPEVIYECDVFIKDGGGYYDWCKIDVEIDNLLDYLGEYHDGLDIKKIIVKVKQLPFKPIDSFVKTSATDEQKTFLDKLYTDYFIKKTSDFKRDIT
jgi:hypothetical protein